MKNKVLNYALAIATIVSFVLYVIFIRDAEFTLDRLVTTYASLLWTGFGNTILISLITLVGSLLLGFILY